MITDTLTIDSHTYIVRSATREEVPIIVALLADDVLGSQRESADTDLAPYFAAFDRITEHANQDLLVIERSGQIVGTFDVSVLASLSRQGAMRMHAQR